MMMFHIRVNTGDHDVTRMYWFVHKQYATLTAEEQSEDWDKAVKELNHIYKDYGRFATPTGVMRFFGAHGFEITIP